MQSGGSAPVIQNVGEREVTPRAVSLRQPPRSECLGRYLEEPLARIQPAFRITNSSEMYEVS